MKLHKVHVTLTIPKHSTYHPSIPQEDIPSLASTAQIELTLDLFPAQEQETRIYLPVNTPPPKHYSQNFTRYPDLNNNTAT
mmetsp:Transcript_15534/g.26235  ORF Transcript_15534/g.26235 Transcript_15534/m.26235 type:complete len:81 (-) Transcript_15534:478-720(-)